jgi:hypothetical protein
MEIEVSPKKYTQFFGSVALKAFSSVKSRLTSELLFRAVQKVQEEAFVVLARKKVWLWVFSLVDLDVSCHWF